MIRLGLIRHGHTAWNRAGRIQGRTDMPLDDDARAQLATLRLPESWAQADVVSSPLARASETAQLLTGRAPSHVSDLVEMDWGKWEGAQGTILRADPTSGFRDIEDWGWSYRPPGGESPDDVRTRLVPWVNGLKRDTIAICHIGIMRVLLAVATGWNFAGPAPFRIKRNRIFALHIDGGGWTTSGPERLEVRSPCA
ncbi:MAG: histidine phosphatase family protein [Pseudomonadota bacterium]